MGARRGALPGEERGRTARLTGGSLGRDAAPTDRNRARYDDEPHENAGRPFGLHAIARPRPPVHDRFLATDRCSARLPLATERPQVDLLMANMRTRPAPGPDLLRCQRGICPQSGRGHFSGTSYDAAVRITEVTLASDDLTAQAKFWKGTLGLPIRRPSEDVLELPLRSSVIRFERDLTVADPRYHFAINIPPGSIRDAADWVNARHELLAFHGDPDEEEGATIVHTDRGAATLYFLDGGGNVVELIANHHLHERYDGSFGAHSLLEIAEIGVATADVEATRQAVQEAFGSKVLWGGRPGWQLTAIGDDHGVVIVAPAGRGWIPVGLTARPLPTTIAASGPRACEITLDEGPYRLRAEQSPASTH